MAICRSMVSRIFIFYIFGAAVLPAEAAGQAACTTQARTVLYAAVGPDLIQYDLDLNAATLAKRSSVSVPENVQEATVLEAAPSQEYLYAAWSDGGPVNGVIPPGPHLHHGISAFRIDPASGALLQDGSPIVLPSRPTFITTDRTGTHVLTSHNAPSSVNVYKIMPDGTIGARVPQPANLDFGVFGHQVRPDPSGKTIFLTTRGNPPAGTSPEDPGAIKIFGYKDGVLGNLLSIAPGRGLNYQVRHLDFDPSGRWVYATLEKQNQIHVYRRMPDGTLSAEPLFIRSTLMKTTPAGTGQAASIHVHPNGKFVYVANRTLNGGGENTIAVFSINQRTGEPELIQSIETRGIEARTFTLDYCGKILAVGNQQAGTIRDSVGTAITVPGSIALFRIRGDGRLEFARKYDVDTTPVRTLFWVGMASLP
jgi:6-phosphogluconolactonase